MIPAMLIQPFVENALIHGIAGKKNKGQLSIRIYLENETVICEIEDNGEGILETAKRKRFTEHE